MHDGAVDAMELSDIENLGPLQQIEAELAELLAEEDVVNLAASMDPGSTAGVLIWENLWAAPFASAARRAGGQLIADGRIPIQAIIASIEADIDDEAKETDMPLRAARVGRVGVIGHPVAKTAVVAARRTTGGNTFSQSSAMLTTLHPRRAPTSVIGSGSVKVPAVLT